MASRNVWIVRWRRRPSLLVALLFLPTALLVETYPTPAPWVSCSSDCPRNAFMAVAHEPRVIEQLVIPAQVLLAIALFVAIIARLADRVRGATRLGRRTLTPLLAVAMGWALLLGVTLGVRLAWPGIRARGGHGLAGRASPFRPWPWRS